MDCDGNRCIFWTLTNKMFVFIGTKKAFKYFGTVLSILYINYSMNYSMNVCAAFAVTATDRYG